MSIEQARKIHDTALIVYQRLIEILRIKVQYPPDSEWADWVKGISNIRYRDDDTYFYI